MWLKPDRCRIYLSSCLKATGIERVEVSQGHGAPDVRNNIFMIYPVRQADRATRRISPGRSGSSPSYDKPMHSCKTASAPPRRDLTDKLMHSQTVKPHRQADALRNTFSLRSGFWSYRRDARSCLTDCYENQKIEIKNLNKSNYVSYTIL
jgi:hypothetical protein